MKDLVDKERAIVQQRVREFESQGGRPPRAGPDGKFRILSIDGGGMRGKPWTNSTISNFKIIQKAGYKLFISFLVCSSQAL